MKPFIINGEVWRIVRVKPGDPRLIDRTNHSRLATTDSQTNTIHISAKVTPPLLDRVLLHEIAHAITISYGLLDSLHMITPSYSWVNVEEWAVSLIENYAIEASALAAESIGRPLCIHGYCNVKLFESESVQGIFYG